MLIKSSLTGQTSLMGTAIRLMGDHMINAQTNLSIEAMEIDLEMDLSTIRMGARNTMEIFLILHRLKRETPHKIFHTANQEVIKLTIWLSQDLIFDPRLVLHLTNKNFRKIITRRHLMRFASPQPTIPILNCQTFVL